MENRIQRDERGDLGEVVTDGGAHLERMGKDRWFLNCVRSDGSSYALWIHGKVVLEEERPASRRGGNDALLRVHIRTLGLPPRPFNALMNAGIETVADLVKRSGAEIIRLSGMGRVSYGQITAALARHNLELRPEDAREYL